MTAVVSGPAPVEATRPSQISSTGKSKPPSSIYAAVDIPYAAAFSTYFGYAVLIVIGYLRDFFGVLFRGIRSRVGLLTRRCSAASGQQNVKRAPLLVDFDDFYTRRLYLRIADCWGRPIASPAGAWIDIIDAPDVARARGTPGGPRPVPASMLVDAQKRADQSDDALNGGVPSKDTASAALCRGRRVMSTRKEFSTRGSQKSRVEKGISSQPGALATRRVLNLGSYNYLGFGEVPGGVDGCVTDALDTYGVATCDSSGNAGLTDVVVELEELVADFVGKPAAIVMGMGFATNSQLLPSIVGPNDLVISDSLNHASIVVGARSSPAKIRLFEHNNVDSLRTELRNAIAVGNPRAGGAPWERIFVLVEGMYSMEGESPPLREIVAIKKKYGAYLFVDEAHSIGAMGATGRGVCEHYSVDPADVDILMGTFTKSFGAVGGYIASSPALIAQIRARSAGSLYSSAMSPPCARHIIWALRQIAGLDGTNIGRERINSLHENSMFFRDKLKKLRVQTLGDWDSPVIPIMLYNPAKIAAFSRECLARGLAVVVVGFPATPLLLSRARICLSAAHTKEDLVWALQVIDEVAEIIQIKYDRSLMERVLPAALLRVIEAKLGTGTEMCT